MKRLSSGAPSTLGVYRDYCTAIFGKESKAVAYLDKKIEGEGVEAEVLADEGQMLLLLTALERD